ncbi:efflux RND transporter periplasmic adaptor subunit [Thiothrix litoralis]|uniref:Efflux RND transporter periplasmic adaptor subunit n=1 Tax=Thiothrix litoralis TaxID=2891210 RepID=A0ABX7WMN8_9GAMM|nr:efflux RND transporter periplasmic adaptor subunit [Thiothrix litoralis]QTR44570.1 efflux RND transporter periplasmic adaptor subunit [Thiothrix litoralis]
MSNTVDSTSSSSVKAVLAAGGRKKRQGNGGKWLFTLLVAALVAGGAWYYFMGQSQTSHQASYKTTPAEMGNLSVTVTATGNLQPKNQVDIGTELSGTIDEVLVDANEVVKKGQKLASLNTTQLQDTITKGKAALASAQAKVKQAAASIKEARTKLARLRELYNTSGGKLPAKSELDTAEATLERAQADEEVAKTTVTSAAADLRSAQTNLDKAIITSPIDGVVLTRTVESGQTVASSLSAPTLFTLAEDLAQMEVEVGVDEADVGQVKAGQSAEFTVDAWPGRKYLAELTRVSLGSSISDNVVSYITVLAVQNTDLTLRPGMTATATIKTDARENVLLVPNTALHFTPTVEAAPDAPAETSFISKLMPRPPGMGRQKKRTNDSEKTVTHVAGMQTLWVLDNNAPLAVDVETGISDGKMTEIISGDLKAGMQVITESVGSAP